MGWLSTLPALKRPVSSSKAFVFKILYRTNAFDDETGLFSAGKVDSQPIIRFHLNGWLVLVNGLDGFYALFCRTHVGLLDVVAHHSDDQSVKEWQCASYNAVMTNCKGVERAHENTCLHHFAAKVRISEQKNKKTIVTLTLFEGFFRQFLEEIMIKNLAELSQQAGVDVLASKDVVNVCTLTIDLLRHPYYGMVLLRHYHFNSLSDVHGL